MIQALLVGLTVTILGFADFWLCNPMLDRPLIVGTAIGIVLGDVKTGVEVGAALELVFMGVMATAEQCRRIPCPEQLLVQHMQLFWGQVLKQRLHWLSLLLFFARCYSCRKSQHVRFLHRLLIVW